MVHAFVLIQAQPGKAGRRVSEEVAAIPGILSSEDVSGPYDVIAGAEASSLDHLIKSVVVRIQALDGVIRTLVCPVVRLG
jgi:DNA-binding Lrp family transcriptional regulator